MHDIHAIFASRNVRLLWLSLGEIFLLLALYQEVYW